MFINKWFRRKQYSNEFDEYLKKYNIDCNCPTKLNCLYESYKKNKQWIMEHENKVMYNIGETNLTIIDPESFKRMNKTKEDIMDVSSVVGQADEMPESIDWSQTDIKYVSPVVEQGECGACWSFAATGVVESAIAIKNKKDVDNLSEQQLIDCIPPEYGNDQCQGGIVRTTIQYMKEKGVCLDDEYKYVSGVDCKQNTCIAGTCKPCNMRRTKIDYVCSRGEDVLKRQLQKGPVTAIINSSASGLQNYTGGIFYVQPRDKYLNPDHGVLVVGYGEENGKKFWKIKNTWGKKWGEQGYFRIQRGDGNGIGLLGIARQNCSVTIK